MTRVRLNSAAIQALAADQGVRTHLEKVGDEVVEKAKAKAPRNTGTGAESIDKEVVTNFAGIPEVRVTWAKEHFYMIFHELGTSDFPARPFLRPALDEVVGRPSLMAHTTRDGRTIMATQAQIAHWTRGRT